MQCTKAYTDCRMLNFSECSCMVVVQTNRLRMYVYDEESKLLTKGAVEFKFITLGFIYAEVIEVPYKKAKTRFLREECTNTSKGVCADEWIKQSSAINLETPTNN